MSGDTVHAFAGLSERLRALRSRSERLVANRDQLTAELREKQTEVSSLGARQEVLSKVLELYRVLLDKMVLDRVRAIEEITTEGLRSILYDQGLSFRLEMTHKYNKVCADPLVCEGDISGHPLSSFGGGAASIVSLTLRVMTLLRLKRHRMLFLDETLGAVSEDYLELTSQFLRRLSDSSGLPIFLITHKPALLSHATLGYQGDARVDGGVKQLSVKRI